MCDCDFDFPRVQTVEFRTARKAHKCGECGNPINPGEKYRLDKGLLDEWYESKTCNNCQTLYWWASRQYHGDFCFALGELHSCLMDWDIASWDEDVDAYVDCPPGIQYSNGVFSPEPYWSIAREIFEIRQKMENRDQLQDYHRIRIAALITDFLRDCVK